MGGHESVVEHSVYDLLSDSVTVSFIMESLVVQPVTPPPN